MNVVGLHPEELLDRHAANALSVAERSRLDAHLATCRACRFELAARRDFADADVEPPRFSLIVAPRDAFALRKTVATPLPKPRRSKKKAVWMVALAAALFGGVSFAALSGRVPGLVAVLTQAKVATSAHASAHTVAEARAVETRAESALTAAETASAAQPSERAAVRAGANPANVATSAVATPGDTSAETAARTAGDPQMSERARRSALTAAELFHDANAARNHGDTDRAIALYRQVEARFPKSDEAHVSYATLGSLLLDHGDARSALRTFDGYLSHGGGALGEEALVGRALAQQELGSADAEATAWREVLARFPKSVHARVARARLAALGAP